MEYKSVNKYLNKNKEPRKHPIYSFFIKLLICIVIALAILVFLEYDKNGKQIIHKYLYENNNNMNTNLDFQ